MRALGEHHYHFHLFNLGLVPAEDRQVKPLPSQLASLVPKPTDNNITVKPPTPDTEKDTMPLIIGKSKRTAWQTKKLADKLKGTTLAQTLANDSNFILDYIKYKKDDPEHEQVRSPRRLVNDRKGDCDCFAVCIATLLINQDIAFSFRIAKYEQGEWAHIYVIVPKNQKSKSIATRADYTVLDPVTNKHDYEVSYLDKKDYAMSLQFLDGFGECIPAVTKPKPILMPVKSLINQGFVPTGQVLEKSPLNYVQNSDDTFTVSTNQGLKNLPAMLTPEQASLVTNNVAPDSLINSGATQSSEAKQPAKIDDNMKWLLGLAAATVTVIAIASSANDKKLAGLAAQKKKISLLKM
jgi:hypothetical protein